MFGPPEDVAGECNAHLEIGDDYGDNHATMRCALPLDHTGMHCEKYESRTAGEVIIKWARDERALDEG